MKTKTAKQILQEKIGNKAVFSFDGEIALGKDKLNANELVEAMEEYKNQFSQLPASVTDEEIKKVADSWFHEKWGEEKWEPKDAFINGMKSMRSLLNHPPVMGEGWVSVEERKPEFGVIVNIALKHQKQDVYSGFRANGGWYCFRLGEDNKQFIPNGIKEVSITHWRELPSPPHQANT